MNLFRARKKILRAAVLVTSLALTAISCQAQFNTNGPGTITPSGSFGGSGPGYITNGGANNYIPPTPLPAPVQVWGGTNENPNHLFTAGRGAIYNQFDMITGTNFVATWVKGSGTGNTNWVIQPGGLSTINSGTFNGVTLLGSYFGGNGVGLTNVQAGLLAGSSNNNYYVGPIGNPTGTGIWNTAMGYSALSANNGSYNSAFGYQALINNLVGQVNVAVGLQALWANTNGSYNSAFGNNALFNNKRGSYNSAYGLQALYANISGSNNLAVGNQALSNNTNGSYNIAIGPLSGSNVKAGTNNIYIGAAGPGDETNVIRIGTGQTATYIAGEIFGDFQVPGTNLLIGADNNFFAGPAGNPAVTGSDNEGFGLNALSAITDGGQNTALGESALELAADGSENVGVGYNAIHQSNGNYNSALGYEAMLANSGSSNTTLGAYSLNGNSAGSGNIAIGYGAGSKITGNGNIDIGNSGSTADSQVVRIGTNQTDTYLAGVLHANGSQLTALPAANIVGTLGNNTTGNATTATLAASATAAALASNVVSGVAIANPVITGGTYSGSITPAAVNTALPGIMTNDPTTLAFIASNHITDLSAQSDLLNGHNELNGKWGDFRANLIDAMFYYGRFNPTNNLSLMGRSFNPVVNPTWSARGESGGLLILSNLPDLSQSNTILVVYTYPRIIAPGGVFNQGVAAGVGDQASGNFFGLADEEQQWKRLYWAVGSSYWSDTPGRSYTNLVQIPAPNGGMVGDLNTEGQRNVTFISMNGTNLSEYEGWNQGYVNYYAPAASSIGAWPPQTAAMNSVYVGGWGIQGTPQTYQNNFVGQVQAVFIFNCAITTNLAIEATRYARWLEPETTENYTFGDSITANDAYLNYANTNSVWYYLMKRYPNTFCNRNDGVGGTTLASYDSPTFNFFYFAGGLISKITEAHLAPDGGINDLYANGANAITTFGHLTNIVNMAKAADPRWKVWGSTIQPILQTNMAAFGGYNYSPTVDAQRLALNQLIITNAPNYFTGILRRDAWANQRILNPLAGYSTDGLHYHVTTNSWAIYSFNASQFKGDGDYGAGILVDFDGNLGNGQNLNAGNLTGYYQGNLISDSTILSVVPVATNTDAPGTGTTCYKVPFDPLMTNFTVYGTSPSFTFDGVAYYDSFRQSGYQGTGQSGEGLNVVGMAFGVDGNQFSFGMKDGGFGYSINVLDGNGRLLNQFIQTNAVLNDGAVTVWQVNFATSARKTILIETGNRWGYGIYIPYTNGFTPNLPFSRKKFMVIGDSHPEEAYANPMSGVLGPSSQIQYAHPEWNVVSAGEGGTGFYVVGNVGSGTYGTNYWGRIGDVTNQSPDFLLIQSAGNDQIWCTNTSFTNAVYTYATNFLIQTRLALPNTPITVICPEAPFSVNSGTPTWFNEVFLISNACVQAGVNYVDPLLQPWITGNAGTPTTGNALQYVISGSNPHPTLPWGALYEATQELTYCVPNFSPLYPYETRVAAFPNTNSILAGNFSGNLKLPSGSTPGNVSTPVTWGVISNGTSSYRVPLYQ